MARGKEEVKGAKEHLTLKELMQIRESLDRYWLELEKKASGLNPKRSWRNWHCISLNGFCSLVL